VIEVRPFIAGHRDLIKPRPFDEGILLGLDGCADYAPTFEQNPGWTMFVDGVPAAAAGFVILWRGVAEGWALTSALVDKHPVSFQRLVKRLLAETIQLYKLWRVQAVIELEHKQSLKWAAKLGFAREGSMLMMGPNGEDFVRLAKLIPEMRGCHS
jgi:hypothetical protein